MESSSGVWRGSSESETPDALVYKRLSPRFSRDTVRLYEAAHVFTPKESSLEVKYKDWQNSKAINCISVLVFFFYILCQWPNVWLQ